MKNLINSCFLFAVLLFTATSCGDPCEKMDCVNGNCEGEGDCICLNYYQQDAAGACTIAINTLLEGTYDAQYTCESTGSMTTETLQLAVGPNPNEVIVRNFQSSANNDITLALDTDDNVTVSQTTSQPNYNGSGTLSGSVFSFALYSPTDTCQVTLTKQ